MNSADPGAAVRIKCEDSDQIQIKEEHSEVLIKCEDLYDELQVKEEYEGILIKEEVLPTESDNATSLVSEGPVLEFEQVAVRSVPEVVHSPPSVDDSQSTTDADGGDRSYRPLVAPVKSSKSSEGQPSSSKSEEEKRFVCKQCGYGTNIMSDHKKHLRIHSGLKPFACQKCDYQATQSCNLKRHCMKRHNGEGVAKRFICEAINPQSDCPRSDVDDAQSSLLSKALSTIIKSHCMNRHIGVGVREKCDSKQANTFTCKQCSYVTYDSDALETHLLMKHSGKAYQCYQCQYSTLDKSALMLHYQKNHYKDVAQNLAGKSFPCGQFPYEAVDRGAF